MSADMPSLLSDSRDFVGRSRCSVGHSPGDILRHAKDGTCIYCKRQADLYERLEKAETDILMRLAVKRQRNK